MAEAYLGTSRLLWESDHEWSSRKVFLDVHCRRFQGDRLTSLSCAWANWKFLGSTYPSDVQALLQELHGYLPPDLDAKISRSLEVSRAQVKFVKSNKDLGSKNLSKDINTALCKPVAETFQSSCESYLAEGETIPGLYIYLPLDEANSSPISILYESVQKSRACTIEFQDLHDSVQNDNASFSISVSINNRLIAKGTGETRQLAKRACAERALSILKSCQPIGEDERLSHGKLKIVEKGQLVQDAYVSAPKLSENNVGNMLMKKMGWAGGGIGKTETGLVEPVFVEAAKGRCGVGHKNSKGSVRKSSVEKAILSFVRDPSQQSIKFSSELSKEDRAVVHILSRKWRLRTKSFGVDKERYVVVSRRF